MKKVVYSQLVKNFIYRIEEKRVIVVQMFNEREDFMMKLFGISGRTQESIDYWGE